MIPDMQELLNEIRELERRVADEISHEAEEFGYTLRKGRISVEQEIARQHKALSTKAGTYLAESSLLFMLTAPVVYSLIVPLLLMDLFATVYQAVCFPLYKIPKVKRSEYLLFDRHRLQYLNWIERTHCVYCSYANGLFAYVAEIGARTEQYWCPIKHAKKVKTAHSRYYNFLSYGDAEGYATQLDVLRKQYSDLRDTPPKQES